jgi:hypothetical protein
MTCFDGDWRTGQPMKIAASCCSPRAFAVELASIIVLAACGGGGSTGTLPADSAAGSDDGASPEATSRDDAAVTRDSAGNAGRPEAGPVPCAVDAGVCPVGEVCFDFVFINGLPRPPDSGPPPPPSNTYSCRADPCGGVADAGCYCTLCGGGTCQSSPGQVSCTEESVCASADTPIATAEGDRPIASIHVGDRVYSADRGALRLVPVVQVGRVPVYRHHVVELALSNGLVLRMSAGHPTADGRLIGALQPGARLEDVIVIKRSDVAYMEPYTYDILPASETHSYVAGGVLVGSTLRR